MMPINRRELLRSAAGAGAALLALPGLGLAADEPKKGAGFTLPKLPYAYDALEPFIDAKTMEIHHDKHHAAYVANLNKAVAGTEWATRPIAEVLLNLDKVPEKIRTAVRNNGGGHYNHSLFWQMMAPKGKGGKPSGALDKAISASFTDLDGLLKQLKASGMTRFGSGWAWVIATPDGKLKVVSTPNQDDTLMDHSGVPILGVDVWEHAYYLKYQNRRNEYLDNWVNVINWDFVASRLDHAMKVLKKG